MTGFTVSITLEMASSQMFSSSEYHLVVTEVATGLICTLVDALTRPSTESRLTRFRGGGLPSPGDRARTRVAFFSYNGGGRMDFEVPESGWSGRSSSSMGGNKVVVGSGDDGAGDEENL